MTAVAIHAGCVAIGGRGVLIAGRSGTGKSDLALRLVDRGARLVSDDYTLVEARDGRLVASAPHAIAGRMEARGVGILAVPHDDAAIVALILDLDTPPERMPEPATREIGGVPLPLARLAALEASAPIKVERLLAAVPR